ncbi:RpiB/LacA/LacB family sugar-phosphate isomerase [Candidatus Woesearchaeota archaeon]|nr:RpiB/LacA/LacB family sugar-phosphate isomerase [Candidatus Woesearchaeota archaeon]
MLEPIVKEGIVIPVGDHVGKTVVLASDHRGFILKQHLCQYLSDLYFTTLDVGTCSPERCDYPTYGAALGGMISAHPLDHVGIAICGTGIGMGIVAGKWPRVYPARCLTEQEAALARQHNNSNVLLLGAEALAPDTASHILSTWLHTPFYSGPQDDAYLQRYIMTVKLEQRLFK